MKASAHQEAAADLRSFDVQVQYLLPIYVNLAIEAESPAQAAAMAMEWERSDGDFWQHEQRDYDGAGQTHVACVLDDGNPQDFPDEHRSQEHHERATLVAALRKIAERGRVRIDHPDGAVTWIDPAFAATLKAGAQRQHELPGAGRHSLLARKARPVQEGNAGLPLFDNEARPQRQLFD